MKTASKTLFVTSESVILDNNLLIVQWKNKKTIQESCINQYLVACSRVSIICRNISLEFHAPGDIDSAEQAMRAVHKSNKSNSRFKYQEE
jgi:hypothetical protein